jgi:hypothetical protein
MHALRDARGDMDEAKIVNAMITMWTDLDIGLSRFGMVKRPHIKNPKGAAETAFRRHFRRMTKRTTG